MERILLALHYWLTTTFLLFKERDHGYWDTAGIVFFLLPYRLQAIIIKVFEK